MHEDLSSLSGNELKAARNAWKKIANGKTELDMWELRAVFQEANSLPTEEEFVELLGLRQRLIYPTVFAHSAAVDPETRGVFTEEKFLSILVRMKGTQPSLKDEGTRLAFVSLGGNPDRTGSVKTEKLRKRIAEFGSVCKRKRTGREEKERCGGPSLPVDIDKLITELDTDGSGAVDFAEFSKLF